MDPVIFQAGPVQVRWYGLMYVVAIIVGIFLANREVKRRGMDLTLDDILDFVLITIPIAIVGARLYYVAFKWPYYGQHLGDIYRIWEGGLAIHGGLIGGALALWLFSRWKKLSFWAFADVIAPPLILGQALGRFGNFMNGDAYGIPTDMPWGIVFPRSSPAGSQFPEMHLHPTMLYEMVGGLVIFAVLWWLRTKPFKHGFLISLYAILYSVLRFGVEFFRGDALCIVGKVGLQGLPVCVQGAQTFLESLRTAQVISVIIILIFATLMVQWELYKRRETGASGGARPRKG